MKYITTPPVQFRESVSEVQPLTIWGNSFTHFFSSVYYNRYLTVTVPRTASKWVPPYICAPLFRGEVMLKSALNHVVYFVQYCQQCSPKRNVTWHVPWTYIAGTPVGSPQRRGWSD